jgi:hypothetical protein
MSDKMMAMTHGCLIDGSGSGVVDNGVVVWQGDRIQAVGPAGTGTYNERPFRDLTCIRPSSKKVGPLQDQWGYGKIFPAPGR